MSVLVEVCKAGYPPLLKIVKYKSVATGTELVVIELVVHKTFTVDEFITFGAH